MVTIEIFQDRASQGSIVVFKEQVLKNVSLWEGVVVLNDF